MESHTGTAMWLIGMTVSERELESLALVAECCRIGKYKILPSNYVELRKWEKLYEKKKFKCDETIYIVKKMIMHSNNLPPCCVKGICK